MSEENVRIVELEPMRIATVWGFGESPELVAWEALEHWAGARGLFDDPEAHPIYGFNNPSPAPGSPNYGYELWIKVGNEVEPEGDVRIEAFGGGLYAVTRCEVPEGQYDVIGATWQRLAMWREDSPFHAGSHQWLEKSVLTPQWPGAQPPPGIAFVLDLYLPIVKGG
jgi:DNA gyrase inhibitor GyrI